MKYIFIVNPIAGKEDKTMFIKKCIAGKGTDFGVYTTKSRGDAKNYVEKWLRDHPGEEVRFYACGGDGTLNEVVSGAMGYENAAVGVYPCGSGNDYVRYYGGGDRFLDIERLIGAKEDRVDVISVNDRWAINAFHMGFDSVVAGKMSELRRVSVIGGRNAYTSAVVYGLFKGMKTPCRIIADGEDMGQRTILLATSTCGTHVGGGYNCAPRSVNNDGFMELCIVKPLSRLTFLKVIGIYKAGKHLDDPSLQKYIIYRRVKKLEISGGENFKIALDGEVVKGTRFKVEIKEKALRFLVPEI